MQHSFGGRNRLKQRGDDPGYHLSHGVGEKEMFPKKRANANLQRPLVQNLIKHRKSWLIPGYGAWPFPTNTPFPFSHLLQGTTSQLSYKKRNSVIEQSLGSVNISTQLWRMEMNSSVADPSSN